MVVPQLTAEGQKDLLSLPAILLIERDPVEVFFVESLIRRILKADVWLWHEEKLELALKLLAVTRFRLILLGAPFPRVSLRSLVRQVQAVAAGTPILLRLPPEELSSVPGARAYGVAGVAPKQHAESVLQALRRVLPIQSK